MRAAITVFLLAFASNAAASPEESKGLFVRDGATVMAAVGGVYDEVHIMEGGTLLVPAGAIIFARTIVIEGTVAGESGNPWHPAGADVWLVASERLEVSGGKILGGPGFAPSPSNLTGQTLAHGDAGGNGGNVWLVNSARSGQVLLDPEATLVGGPGGDGQDLEALITVDNTEFSGAVFELVGGPGGQGGNLFVLAAQQIPHGAFVAGRGGHGGGASLSSTYTPSLSAPNLEAYLTFRAPVLRATGGPGGHPGAALAGLPLTTVPLPAQGTGGNGGAGIAASSGPGPVCLGMPGFFFAFAPTAETDTTGDGESVDCEGEEGTTLGDGLPGVPGISVISLGGAGAPGLTQGGNGGIAIALGGHGGAGGAGKLGTDSCAPEPCLVAGAGGGGGNGGDASATGGEAGPAGADGTTQTEYSYGGSGGDAVSRGGPGGRGGDGEEGWDCTTDDECADAGSGGAGGPGGKGGIAKAEGGNGGGAYMAEQCSDPPCGGAITTAGAGGSALANGGVSGEGGTGGRGGNCPPSVSVWCPGGMGGKGGNGGTMFAATAAGGSGGPAHSAANSGALAISGAGGNAWASTAFCWPGECQNGAEPAGPGGKGGDGGLCVGGSDSCAGGGIGGEGGMTHMNVADGGQGAHAAANAPGAVAQAGAGGASTAWAAAGGAAGGGGKGATCRNLPPPHDLCQGGQGGPGNDGGRTGRAGRSQGGDGGFAYAHSSSADGPGGDAIGYLVNGPPGGPGGDGGDGPCGGHPGIGGFGSPPGDLNIRGGASGASPGQGTRNGNNDGGSGGVMGATGESFANWPQCTGETAQATRGAMLLAQSNHQPATSTTDDGALVLDCSLASGIACFVRETAFGLIGLVLDECFRPVPLGTTHYAVHDACQTNATFYRECNAQPGWQSDDCAVPPEDVLHQSLDPICPGMTLPQALDCAASHVPMEVVCETLDVDDNQDCEPTTDPCFYASAACLLLDDVMECFFAPTQAAECPVPQNLLDDVLACVPQTLENAGTCPVPECPPGYIGVPPACITFEAPAYAPPEAMPASYGFVGRPGRNHGWREGQPQPPWGAPRVPSPAPDLPRERRVAWTIATIASCPATGIRQAARRAGDHPDNGRP